jgi:Spy/CpxP family protein refolding chaperone
MKKTLMITAIALATTAGMTLTATAQCPNSDPANCPMANGAVADCPMSKSDCPLADGKKGFEGKKGKKGAGPGSHRGEGRMLAGLDLTDAQKAQIDDIMAQQREETHAKIRAILTPEQQATFDARQQGREARLEKRQKN